MEQVKELINNDLPDVDKIAAAFEHITGRHLSFSEKEIELMRALADKESLVKEQIKYETIKHVRSIFQDCFYLVMGRRAWDE